MLHIYIYKNCTFHTLAPSTLSLLDSQTTQSVCPKNKERTCVSAGACVWANMH